MADSTDIQLLGDQITIDGQRQVIVHALDLCVDSAARRSEHTTPDRRALVHDNGDALTVNYANDYPGGVSIHGLKTIDSKPKMMTSPSAIHLTISGNAKIVGGLAIDAGILGDLVVQGRVRFHGKQAPGTVVAVPPGGPAPAPAPPLDLADVIFSMQQEIAALKKKVGL